MVESPLKPENLVSTRLQNEIFIDALKKLACLGNGNNLGNSEGNIVAQRALVKAGVPL